MLVIPLARVSNKVGAGRIAFLMVRSSFLEREKKEVGLKCLKYVIVCARETAGPTVQ